MKFKSEQTKLKLHRIANVMVESDSALNKNQTYDRTDLIALSQVFNVPESDIKKIYENFFEITKFPMIFKLNK